MKQTLLLGRKCDAFLFLKAAKVKQQQQQQQNILAFSQRARLPFMPLAIALPYLYQKWHYAEATKW